MRLAYLKVYFFMVRAVPRTRNTAATTLRPELLGNEGYTTIHMRVPKSLHQIEILFLEIYIASLASWPVPQKNSLRGRNRAQRELRLL